MTQGKNPKNFAKKKMGKKKIAHAFSKKEWYQVKIPVVKQGAISNIGFMPVWKTVGTKIST